MDTSPARIEDVNEALVEPVPLVAAGAAEGFAELYERTFPRIYAYVASLLRDRAAAEDVTSQAFERAYRKRRSYRPARASMDAWLFGIARNAALDELRRRKRRAVLEIDPEDTASPDPRGPRRARPAARDRARRAGGARRPGARPDRAQVLRRPVQRRDRPRARHVRVERRHPAAPNHHEAEKGLQ